MILPKIILAEIPLFNIKVVPGFACNPDRINRELMEQIDLSAAQIKSRDQEIERLKGELREATESLEATMAEEQVPLTSPQ